MYIKNVFETADTTKLVKQTLLDNHSRQVLVLNIPAGAELKQHVSKVDALLIVKKGTALFNLWHHDKHEIYELAEHDMVAFKADQLHSILAHTNFAALVIK